MSNDPVHGEVIEKHKGYTYESGADVTKTQKERGYQGPSAQEPGEPWWHTCDRINSWDK